jgi:hypothetical protein
MRMRMNIVTIPTTPLTMGHMCERCPLGVIRGFGSEEPLVEDGEELELELELGAEVEGNTLTGVDEAEPEAPDGLSSVPGSSSGKSIRSKTGVRRQSGERGRWGKKGEKFLPPTACEMFGFQLFPDWDVL